MDTLRSDRMFNSPDSLTAMAEEYGIHRALSHLSGSALTTKATAARILPTYTSTSTSTSTYTYTYTSTSRLDRRTFLAGLDRAWSMEALRRGVLFAQAKDYAQAFPCYQQALEMDPLNADAYVVREGSGGSVRIRIND